jgi:hypothetical protein
MTGHVEPTPTTLQQLRQLVSDEHTVHPWSSVDQMMDALIGRIRRHTGDDPWRAQLTALVLAQRTGDAAARPWHELVTRDNLDALLREIDGPGDQAPRGIRSLLQAMSVPAILGLSAMTMAVGCARCPEAQGIPASEQDLYCELVDLINGSDIYDGQKEDLMDCLPNMSDGERQDLVDLFADYTAEEIADHLTTLAATCEPAGDDDDASDDDAGH